MAVQRQAIKVRINGKLRAILDVTKKTAVVTKYITTISS